MGIEVVICNNVDEVLEWLNKNMVFDLIMLDIVMLDISGYDLCCKIWGELVLEDVFIVFCFIKNEDYDCFWVLCQGGNVYLIKFYSFIELMKIVKFYIFQNLLMLIMVMRLWQRIIFGLIWVCF